MLSTSQARGVIAFAVTMTKEELAEALEALPIDKLEALALAIDRVVTSQRTAEPPPPCATPTVGFGLPKKAEGGKQ